jgi:hypothetical protein
MADETRDAGITQAPPPKPKVIAWKKSEAKEILKDAIVEGRVTDDMQPMEVYKMRPEYKPYKYANFRTNLRNLRAKIEKDYGRRDRDCMDYFGHDAQVREGLRQQAIVANGGTEIILWHLSDAQLLLKEDITTGFHLVVKPSELWQSRAEYQKFSLKVFRKHIYQEVDAREKRRTNFKKKSANTRKIIKRAIEKSQTQDEDNNN